MLYFETESYLMCLVVYKDTEKTFGKVTRNKIRTHFLKNKLSNKNKIKA